MLSASFFSLPNNYDYADFFSTRSSSLQLLHASRSPFFGILIRYTTSYHFVGIFSVSHIFTVMSCSIMEISMSVLMSQKKFTD